MNDHFRAYVEAAERAARGRGLTWDPPFDRNGKIAPDHRWSLTALAGLAPPPTVWLSDYGFAASATAVLNGIRERNGLARVDLRFMPAAWREFFRAVVITDILVGRNKPHYTIAKAGAAIRIMAMCAPDKMPWRVDGDDVRLAYNVALGCGSSGAAAKDLTRLVKLLFERGHLADVPALSRFCTPYPTAEAAKAQASVERLQHDRGSHGNTRKRLEDLAERKDGGKLPDERALWELVRIVFIERPRSFTDAVLFAMARVAILTGLRAGEICTIPADWERWQDYVDADGRPAGEKGGISRSLMLKHFAEKQERDAGRGGVVLVPRAQHVPSLFQEALRGTLAEVGRITAPLRRRLEAQTLSGRIFPEYDRGALVPALEMYTRVTGMLQISELPIPDGMIERYQAGYDPAVLGEMAAHQRAALELPHSVHTGKALRTCDTNISGRVGQFWLERGVAVGLTLRGPDGSEYRAKRLDWHRVHLRVGEVEDWFRLYMRRRLPDTAPFTLQDGSRLFPHEMLFLRPQFSHEAIEGGKVVDVTAFCGAGRVTAVELTKALGGRSGSLSRVTIFRRYGSTPEDRALHLWTHSLRHLQNTELFRLGVADTIITKRFDRTSVAQSHVYDHRSLAESLDAVDVPTAVRDRMGPRAREAFRLIAARRASGPIVDEFRRVQREHGDGAAFDYLDAEAGGLHATPYGLCLNSFMVDPCPKHLECFNGCRHLARTDLPGEQASLEQLRDRMRRVVAKIEAAPADTVGRRNQMEHARVRLANIETALAAAPGAEPFPDGPDLGRPLRVKAAATILTSAKRKADHA